MFEEKSLQDAEKYNTLGPAYFEARPIIERLMTNFEAEHFKPIVDACVKEFQCRMWDSVRDHLLSDTEMNIHGHVYRMVDDCVAAILSGESWAIQRYALGSYNQEKARAAIAKHIPQELQDARIADLEKEVERLRSDLQFYRDR